MCLRVGKWAGGGKEGRGKEGGGGGEGRRSDQGGGRCVRGGEESCG